MRPPSHNDHHEPNTDSHFDLHEPGTSRPLTHAAKRKSRGWRWVKRGVLGTLGFLVLAVGGAIGIIHTDWGRDKLRGIVESQLDHTFTGGAKLGKLEGSPFTVLTIRDLVINGPDKQPAIKIDTVKVDVGLLPLVSHQVRVLAVKADGVDVDLKRDASGGLQIAHLMKPDPEPKQKSAWSIDLPDIELRNAHIKFDAGTEIMNFDALTLDARAKMPNDGPIDASLELALTWRERNAIALAVQTVVHASDKDGLVVPYLQVHAGDQISVIGNGVHVVTSQTPGQLPAISGTLAIKASAAAVAQLVPQIKLPDDVDVTIDAHALPDQPWTQIALAGKLGQTQLQLQASADLAGKHARGELTTGTLDLTKLSANKVVGQAAAAAVFDVRPGGAKALPVATATVRGWGEVAGIPRTHFELSVSSAGERAQAKLDATGEGVKIALDASVHSVDQLLAIEAATFKASIVDPARASGGKAPVHGTLTIDLAAHGTVMPQPSLAVTGTIDGKQLRYQDARVGTLHVAIDADKLPARPLGSLHLQATDIVRQTLQLETLSLDANDRRDGRVGVTLRTSPKANPWLFDVDLLITPPAKAAPDAVVVDLTHHHIRVANGTDWNGNSGHIEVGPEQISIRKLTSASQLGKLAIDGFYDRAGKNQGDFRAKVEAKGISLESFGGNYHGMVDAHIEAGKHHDVWDGEVILGGKAIMLDPSLMMIDASTHVALHGTKLKVEATASSHGLGDVQLALDIDTPKVVTDARAWKKLGRDALRDSRLQLQKVQIRRLAELAGLEGDYSGQIDGDFQVTAQTMGGRLEVKHVVAPQLKSIPGVDVQLDLTQTAPTELAPSMIVNVEGIGRIEANAKLEMPANLFDPVAWQALGPKALNGAAMRIENINVDPAMLDRLGIASDARGRLDVAVDVGEAASTINAKVRIGELRATPLVQPINIALDATVDAQGATTSLAIKTTGPDTNKDGGLTLLTIDGKLPGAPADIIAKIKAWRANPAAGSALPLQVTAKLPQVQAAKLLAIVGRTEVTGGQINGTIELGGTLAKPSAKADIEATGLTVPPGRGGTPVRTVDKLAITGSWDGDAISVKIDGKESDGGSLALALDARQSAMRDGKLTLKAEKLDLMPILAFAPGPAGGASGQLNADLKVTGLDPRTMQLAGELHLLDGRVPVAPAVGTLRSAKIDAVIADHQVTIGVDGKLGGGDLKVTGSVALDGAAPGSGKAKLTLRKISPIGSIEPQITADVTATLGRQNNQWHAQLVVDHGSVVIPKDKGEALKPVGAPTDMKFVNGDTKPGADNKLQQKVPEDPVFLIDIALHPTNIESEEFRGNLHGKLQIKVGGDAVGLVGNITADSGDLDLFARRYYLDRATVNFDGPPDPLLDVRITHDFPDFTSITEIHGRLSKPQLILSANPGTYSQGELLGFLLGGDPSGDPQNSSTTNRATDAGTSFLANKLSGYVKGALPISIDVLRYESATASSSAAVDVGTWLTHTLFLEYRQHLDALPNENIGEGSLEYWFTRRLMLEGTAGDRNVDGIDLLWRKRY